MAAKTKRNPVPMETTKSRRHCPKCKTIYETTTYQAKPAIALGQWVVLQAFLNVTPYVHLRIHSFRVPGLKRQWSANLLNEENIVLFSGGAPELGDAVAELVGAIKDKVIADKKKKG